jgi:ATP-dependent Lon protease
MTTCTYVFKRGPRRGQVCKEKVCSKHYTKPKLKSNLPDDPLKERIQQLNTSTTNKNEILKHYINMKRLDPTSTEYYKNQIFVDKSLRYPWNKVFDIYDALKDESVKSFITQVKESLDKEIYGMENVKDEIVNLVCKLISNPSSTRNNIALHGCAGVGKSKFIQVLSKVLKLPLKIIPLGGIKDPSFFLGHGYVYVESGPGKIIQNIIDAGWSNPIIYFDELDKVSETDGGKDIHSFLTYLTDNTQNSEFTDHYFYGMKFDLSRVFYVFTFNDVNKIDKVLLDRLNIIHVPSPSQEETSTILQKHCLPEILKNIGIPFNIKLSQNQVQVIIQKFKDNTDKLVSSGIREYYRIIEKIMMEVNKDILLETVTFDDKSDDIVLDDALFDKYIKKLEQQYVYEIPGFLHMYA